MTCPGVQDYSLIHGALKSLDNITGTATFICDPGYAFVDTGAVAKTIDCMDCDEFPRPWLERVRQCSGVMWHANARVCVCVRRGEGIHSRERLL